MLRSDRARALARAAWPYAVPVGLVALLAATVLPSVVRGYDLPVPQSPPTDEVCEQSRVRLLWHATPGEGPYEIDVSRSADFDPVTFTRSATGTALVLPRLSAGVWHWRVRRGQTTGPPSRFRVPPHGVVW